MDTEHAVGVSDAVSMIADAPYIAAAERRAWNWSTGQDAAQVAALYADLRSRQCEPGIPAGVLLKWRRAADTIQRLV